jgi:hypothetical protein
MHLEVLFVMILILSAPLIVVLGFFSWNPNSFPQRVVCRKCYPLEDTCCGADHLFSPIREGTGFFPFMGNQRLSCSHRGSGGSLCTVVGRPNSICSLAEYHSV